MQQHPAFKSPVCFTKNKQVWTTVCYDLNPGDIVHANAAANGQTIFGTVQEVLDTRPSSGNFNNYHRPNHYTFNVVEIFNFHS